MGLSPSRAESTGPTTLLLRQCAVGSPAARNNLHAHIFRRVHDLVQKELAKFGRVAAFVDADDVQQEVQLKLDGVLKTKPPGDSRALWALISLMVPQVLIDLHRKCVRRPVVLENQLQPSSAATESAVGLAAVAPGTVGDEPCRLSEWTEFHRRALALPEPQGTAFRLIWYHGMPREQVAEAMSVTVKTVYNHFRAALDDLRPYAPVP